MVVLRRAQEREADLVAARHAGARALGDALIRMRLDEQGVDEMVAATLRRDLAESASVPEAGPMALRRRLAKEPLPESAGGWLQQALARVTTAVDSHPCLKDRLEALGVPPRLPPPVESSAADDLLGERVDGFVRRLDAE